LIRLNENSSSTTIVIYMSIFYFHFYHAGVTISPRTTDLRFLSCVLHDISSITLIVVYFDLEVWMIIVERLMARSGESLPASIITYIYTIFFFFFFE